MITIGTIFFLCSVVSARTLYNLEVGDKCGPNNERQCAVVIGCSTALERLHAGKPHGLELCGFQGETEIVCCEVDTDPTEGPPRPSVAACERYFNLYTINSKPLISHGVNASLGDVPYIASIGYDGDEPGEIEWGKCGGSLISESFILTAAHCTVRVDNKLPKIVRLGKIDLYGDEDNVTAQDIPVQDVIVHPDYKGIDKFNDIALLRLAKPAEFTEYVKPVCLNIRPEIATGLIIAGWGYINQTTEESSRFLQKAYVIPYDLDKCNETYLDQFQGRALHATQLCAIYRNKNRPEDTCKGDSGGPIQVQNRNNTKETPLILVGITSFGKFCPSTTPSVYTRVSSYIDWIEANVWH